MKKKHVGRPKGGDKTKITITVTEQALIAIQHAADVECRTLSGFFEYAARKEADKSKDISVFHYVQKKGD